MMNYLDESSRLFEEHVARILRRMLAQTRSAQQAPEDGKGTVPVVVKQLQVAPDRTGRRPCTANSGSRQ